MANYLSPLQVNVFKVDRSQQSRFPQINNPPKKQLLLTYWYIFIDQIHFLLNIIKHFHKKTYFCEIQNVHGFKWVLLPTVTYIRLSSREKIPLYFSYKFAAEIRLNSLIILYTCRKGEVSKHNIESFIYKTGIKKPCDHILIDCILIQVQLGKFSFTWRRHNCLYESVKFKLSLILITIAQKKICIVPNFLRSRACCFGSLNWRTE